MNIRITPKNGVPLYVQIRNQVKFLVAAGRLKPGDEVPAIRALAEQLLINPNTVARAYRELESEGVLVTRQGAGTTVGEGGSRLSRTERMRILSERVDGLITEARQLDVPIDDVTALLHERNHTLNPSPSEGDTDERAEA
jgi:GntR family transcriptional regulator